MSCISAVILSCTVVLSIEFSDVTVQVVKTYRLRSYLRMAYPAAMETRPALSHEVWEQTPPKAQAYIRALEARVATLEGMMQALQDQLNQTSRNSSRPPSSDPPQSERSRRPRSTRRRGGQPGHPGPLNLSEFVAT